MAKQKISEILHFEIPAKDMNSLRQFYTDVFGWKFKNTATQDMQYWTIDTGTSHKPGVDGGMYKRGSMKETPINYIGTADINESMAAVTRAGGHITVEKREIAGHGWTAVGTDPEGNPVGLFQSMDRGIFRSRGKQSQSGANRVPSAQRHNYTADSK